MYFVYMKYVVNGVTWEIFQSSPRSNYNVKKDGELVNSMFMYHQALEIILHQFNQG